MPVEFDDQRSVVKVNPRDLNKVIIQEVNNEVKISASGPQGVQGPTGPTGPTGPGMTAEEIIDAVSYTHNQSATSNVWSITHGLSFYPNVTVFDSADTMVEGAVLHNDENSLTITFSAQISGKAHLS